MELLPTVIPDVKIVVPKLFCDSRGYFVETYNEERYRAAGSEAHFIQQNESCSMRGVVRGLHWQAAPYTQAKLVRVICGAVWDVAVDVREGSPTFGLHVAALLTAENKHQFYVPRGFAHGFAVLEDRTIFTYLCDNVYHPQSERGLQWNDPELKIPWPNLLSAPILSEKDTHHACLKDIEPWRADA
ncbi:MAG: dTDP-4-dehydrorhamnose 3,5-epimerase [Kiritimatiellia bacterium]